MNKLNDIISNPELLEAGIVVSTLKTELASCFDQEQKIAIEDKLFLAEIRYELIQLKI